MSKKFTGVHSGGQNIPVYDKDAHSAIEQKLNTSAFQSVSGNFLTAVPDAYATKDYADTAANAAASGKLDTDTFSQVSGDFLTAVPQSYLQNTDLTVTSGKVTEISGIPLSAGGGTLPDTIPVSGVSGISVTETENEVLIGISADFATPTDLEKKLDTSAFSSVSGNFLTAVPENYSTKEYLSEQISGKYDTSSFAAASGDFLTAVPESAISGFATETYVDSAVSGKQNTLEFGYDDSSAISGINGSALAGGIDPSMLTGYAEYSAISAKLAPGDIAIFTYGKQSAAYPYILSAYAAGKLCYAKHEVGKYYYPLVSIQSADPNYGAASGYNRAVFGKWEVGNDSQSVWSATFTTASMEIYFVDGASDKSGSDGWSYGWTQNSFHPQKAGNYYSASNPSGFLTAIPQSAVSGYMSTSGLEYDGDKISGYMGSAFKAGDELPQSVTDAANYVSATSGDIDATIDNVSSNSGVWGGSALPISAGPGIKVNLVDNTLVFSNDETVLYSGQAEGNLTLSDNPLNYERLLVTFNASAGAYDMGAGSEIIEPDKTQVICLHNYFMYQTSQTIFGNMNEAWAVYSGVNTTAWTRTIGGWRNTSTYTSNLNADNNFLKVSKIVGINRISGGN